MNKRKLKWGETPWDKMSREELVREAQRMALALQSAQSLIRQYRASGFLMQVNPNLKTSEIADEVERMAAAHPYWGGNGNGNRTMIEIKQALHTLDRIDEDSFWRDFTNYASSLFFPYENGVRPGFNWAVCPECGVYLGTGDSKENPRIGQPCDLGKRGCDGVMRELRWEDLNPKANAT